MLELFKVDSLLIIILEDIFLLEASFLDRHPKTTPTPLSPKHQHGPCCMMLHVCPACYSSAGQECSSWQKEGWQQIWDNCDICNYATHSWDDLRLGSVQILHKRGRGVWPQLIMLRMPLEGWGVPEQNAYVILELFVLPIRTSWLQTHICLNPFIYGPIWPYALTSKLHYDEIGNFG